jgi:2-polyprenyl-6-methoxyphenol hydroxylase-like FAD-dependent oxidoreductase
MTNRHILIAGGGIGGLAAALGLAARGHRCTVLEKARELGEIGAGIQIGPNAFHCSTRWAWVTRRARRPSTSTRCG